MSMNYSGLNNYGQVTYCLRYLRRTKTVNELTALADSIFQSATDEVTVTTLANDGVHSSGEVTFPKSVIGFAVEKLLMEASVMGINGENKLPAVPGPVIADFSHRLVRT
jgi:hypothetical protein